MILELNKGLSFKYLQILHQDYASHVVLCPCCSLMNIFCAVPLYFINWLQQAIQEKIIIPEIAVLSALLDAFPAICRVAKLVHHEIVDSIISFKGLACPGPSHVFQKYVHQSISPFWKHATIHNAPHLSMKVGD